MKQVTLVSQVFLHESGKAYDPAKPDFEVKQEFEIGDDNSMEVVIPEGNAYAVDVEAGSRDKLKIFAISVPDAPFPGSLHFSVKQETPAKDRIDLSDSKIYTGKALADLLAEKVKLDTAYFWRSGSEEGVPISIFYGRDITTPAQQGYSAPTSAKQQSV